MSEKLPRVTADEVIKALKRVGFSLVRQNGSHKIYKSAQGKEGDRPLPCREGYFTLRLCNASCGMRTSLRRSSRSC